MKNPTTLGRYPEMTRRISVVYLNKILFGLFLVAGTLNYAHASKCETKTITTDTSSFECNEQSNSDLEILRADLIWFFTNLPGRDLRHYAKNVFKLEYDRFSNQDNLPVSALHALIRMVSSSNESEISNIKREIRTVSLMALTPGDEH